MSKKLTQEEFIEKVKKVHGNKYDYSKAIYTNSLIQTKIVCFKHGSFLQLPKVHFRGGGCPKCKGENTSKRFTNNEKDVLRKMILKHDNRYFYPDFNYEKSHSKINILCKEHGLFKQYVSQHLQGVGCPKCAGKNITTSEIVKRFNEIHGYEYGYSKVIYKGANSKIVIICKTHGEFEQKPKVHLRGARCPKCVGNYRYTNKEFIQKCIEINSNKYDYSLVNYKTNKSNIKIICPKHGIFEQIALSHINGHGCSKCGKGKNISKSEIEVADFVKSLNLEILTSKRNIIKPYELDIFIPSLNKAIEFNGTYWHYTHSNKNCKPKGYHAMKSNLCKEKGIKLLHIREDLWIKDKEQMKEVISKFLKIPLHNPN